MIQLIPIQQRVEENVEFLAIDNCRDIVHMTIDYYNRIGWHPPWIGYLAKLEGEFVGSAGYKGGPRNKKIEIAYGTFPQFRARGIGTEICNQLVSLALKNCPTLTITARTLPENNFSTRILQKNGFKLIGDVWDDEDGNVWEWRYAGSDENSFESSNLSS